MGFFVCGMMGRFIKNMRSFFQQLKERKVTKTTVGYAVVAFIIMQLVEILFPIFEFPTWTSKFVIIILFFGLPIVIVLSWIFDISNDKIIRSPQSNGVYFLGGGALIITFLLYFGYDYSSSKDDEKQNLLNEINVNSIAVLPFDNYSKDEPKTDNSGKKSDDDDDNFTNEEHYGKVLGLKGKIKVDDIQRAYHNKIKEYHPDKVAMMGDELKEMATQKTKEINEAYEYFKKKYN